MTRMEVPKINGYERSKALRRRHIAEVAREIVRETGGAGLSMRALADRANVSSATPYNLFGSKHAIMRAVMDLDLEGYWQRIENAAGDNAFDRIFTAIRTIRGAYEREPVFNRAIMLELHASGSGQRNGLFDGPRQAYWRAIIGGAIDQGAMQSEVDADTFTEHLLHMFSSFILDWVLETISLDEMEQHLLYGTAMMIGALAAPDYRVRLKQIWRDAQTELASYPPRTRADKPAVAGPPAHKSR